MSHKRTFDEFYLFCTEFRMCYFRLADDTERIALLVAALDANNKVLTEELKAANRSLKKWVNWLIGIMLGTCCCGKEGRKARHAVAKRITILLLNLIWPFIVETILHLFFRCVVFHVLSFSFHFVRTSLFFRNVRSVFPEALRFFESFASSKAVFHNALGEVSTAFSVVFFLLHSGLFVFSTPQRFCWINSFLHIVASRKVTFNLCIFWPLFV